MGRSNTEQSPEAIATEPVEAVAGEAPAQAEAVKPAKPKNATKRATATAAPEVDLHKALLDELAARGIKPKVKWSPSKTYAGLYVDGKNIGYVFKQSARGMRIEPAASEADLPKGSEGRPVKALFKPGTRSTLFALVGTVTDEAGVKHAAAALEAAAAKRQAAKAAK